MKYAHHARRYIIFITLTGIATALLVIAQSLLIARAAAPVVSGQAGWKESALWVGILAVVMAMRGAIILLRESRAHRAANGAIVELRCAVVKKATELGPRWLAQHSAEVTTLTTRGLDDLGPYFVRYLPQLLLSVTVTPAALIVMAWLDFWSMLVALITIPLIPIFMILIGRLTQDFSSRRLATMQRLGAQLLDLLAGLPTLKALGREKDPQAHVRKLGQSYTKTTMSTLRVAFLSGAVLEFIATLSVALVAVEVGIRLVYNHIDLFTGLAVIMLAPEVYQPLRQVGAHFHASADGVAAAGQTFKILEEKTPITGTTPAPKLNETTIRLENISVAARGTWAPGNLNTKILPGSITALAGASGVGKTTTVMAILGLLRPEKGEVILQTSTGQHALTRIAPTSWWSQITWIPQTPTILPGTIAENIAPDQPISDRHRQAAKDSGFDQVLADLPHGWQTRIGHGGIGLSVGQRQRLALTRALASPRPLVVLDEPTAHLDAVSQEQIISCVEKLHERGCTVIVIAHRAALLQKATHIINVESVPFDQADTKKYAHTDEKKLIDISQTESELPGFLDEKAARR